MSRLSKTPKASKQKTKPVGSTRESGILSSRKTKEYLTEKISEFPSYENLFSPRKLPPEILPTSSHKNPKKLPAISELPQNSLLLPNLPFQTKETSLHETLLHKMLSEKTEGIHLFNISLLSLWSYWCPHFCSFLPFLSSLTISTICCGSTSFLIPGLQVFILGH